jgi:transcriptional regulator with XRE-family HTH domain
MCEVRDARTYGIVLRVSELSNLQTGPGWELADRLRKSMRDAELTTAEMAEELEVSRATVSNWLNGHTRPPASSIRLWAIKCGVDYRWLRDGDDVARSLVHLGSAYRELEAFAQARAMFSPMQKMIERQREMVAPALALARTVENMTAPIRAAEAATKPLRDAAETAARISGSSRKRSKSGGSVNTRSSLYVVPNPHDPGLAAAA